MQAGNKLKLVRTTAATLAALLTLITLASYWGWAGWTGGQFSIVIGNGGIDIGTGSLSGVLGGGFGPPGFTFEPFAEQSLRFFVLSAVLPSTVDSSADGQLFSVPFVPIIVISLAIFFWSHRIIRRRSQLITCPNCRYPLTGLPQNSPCPECGKPTTP